MMLITCDMLPMTLDNLQKAMESMETPVFGFYLENIDRELSKNGPPSDEITRRTWMTFASHRGLVRTLETLNPSLSELTEFANESLSHAVMSGHAHLAIWLIDRGVPWEVASPIQDPNKGLRLCEMTDVKNLAEWGVSLWEEKNPEGLKRLMARWERDHLKERIDAGAVKMQSLHSAL